MTFFYYTHFEIIGGPCSLIGSNWCNLFTNRTIFCSKLHLFPSQWGGYIINKKPIRFQGLFKVTDQTAGKWETKSIMWQILQLLLTKGLLSPTPPPPKMDEFNFRPALSTASIKYLTWPSPLFGWFENGCNKVVTEPRVVQFWSEIILVIMCMISAQIALHSIQLPLWIKVLKLLHGNCIVVNQLASTIVSQLFQCIQVFFFSFFLVFVFFWCLILLILKSLQELLLLMSFSQFHFFPVWMHIFMLSFFPFSSDFYLHLTASQGFPLWFDILHWWHARYSTQLLLWIQTQTWSCLGW